MESIGGRHGVARRREVVGAIGEHTTRRALRDGVLLQPWRGVIMAGERALDPLTRAAAALLAVGSEAVLSHNTAATLLGCAAGESVDVHVTVPYRRWVRSRTGLVVHHDRFVECDVELCHELPTLSMPATITELLCTQRRWIALACLDQALAARQNEGVDDFISEVGRRIHNRDDRKGTNIAQSLLCLGDSRAESPQESRLRLTVLDAGFPAPTPQYEIRALNGRLIYVIDLAWPGLRIGLEYDGVEAHEDRADYDAERDSRMADRGWIMIRVGKQDLAEPAGFIERLWGAFAARGYTSVS